MSTFVRIGKKVKRFAKRVLLPEPACCIERVKTDERVCAMTFDDGPMALPASPDVFGGRALTDVLLDTLDEFGAKGTFDVVGDTSGNYPDVCGALGSPTWGGTAYDHYPCFGQDAHGGALNCPELLERIIREGHQITNHGYRHALFGKKPYVYGKRHVLGTLDAVVDDLAKLDRLLQSHGYRMTMSRPPHYVDRIDKRFTSYDAYDRMGYLYLAASFDGAGWLPSHAEDPVAAELDEMVAPVQKKLAEDPDFFCGQIIFQKDGYNMAKRTPVAAGLRRQLELLTDAGYRIVTVQELLERHSPFSDVGRDDPDFDAFCALQKTRAVVYSNNTLQPDKPMTAGELAMLLAPRSAAVDDRPCKPETAPIAAAAAAQWHGASETGCSRRAFPSVRASRPSCFAPPLTASRSCRRAARPSAAAPFCAPPGRDGSAVIPAQNALQCRPDTRNMHRAAARSRTHMHDKAPPPDDPKEALVLSSFIPKAMVSIRHP